MKKWVSKNGKWTVTFKIEQFEHEYEKCHRVTFSLIDNKKGETKTVAYIIRNYTFQLDQIDAGIPKYVMEKVKDMMRFDVMGPLYNERYKRIKYLKLFEGKTFNCIYGEVTMVKVDQVNDIVYFLEFGQEPFHMNIDDAFEMIQEAY